MGADRTITIQSSLPGVVPVGISRRGIGRQVGVAGDRILELGEVDGLAVLDLFWVRLRMNTGLPRHLTISDMPGVSEATSTSIEASANVEASGRIWSMNGHATAPAPTTAAMPVAT